MPQPVSQIALADFRKFIPINGLREEALQQLHRRARTIVAPAGTKLFDIGQTEADSFYLVRGEVVLCDQTGKVLRNLLGSTPDALHRLAHQNPRKVRAVCRTEVQYIRVDSGLLDVMLTWDQTGSFEVDELHDGSSDGGDWMTRLLQMKAFQKVPPANLQAMFMRMKQIQVKARDVIIRQGDEGDYFYVMTAGRALVTRETPTAPKPIRLAELEAGSCFGEEALISDDRRNASIIMLSNGSLMRLAKEDFRSLLTAPLTNTLSFQAAQELIASGNAQWLDVRLPSEFKSRHIPGALNVPLFMLRFKLATLDRKKTHIIYCNGGRRSAVAAFVMTQAGFETRILDGGMPDDES